MTTPSARFDLVIRNGTLVDGTGAAPRPGEIAIANGRIAALGDPGALAPHAAGTLDAHGAAIAPGFIDIHTHYDAQVFWDRMLTISPWHGVTTVVVGNCGFGVAPTRPGDRDLMLRTLEQVEGMSLDALRAGLGPAWPFEHFGEFLDAIESRGTAIHVGSFVGHTPVRTYVMGTDACEREATEGEIAQMRALVAGALRDGALGFATSKAPTHVGYGGKPVPSRFAARAEIDALAGCLAEAGRGVMQCTIGGGLFFDEMESIARATGRPITWTALLGGAFGPTGHRGVLDRMQKLQDEGVRVHPQVTCRTLQVEFDWNNPLPFNAVSAFRPFLKAGRAGRLALLADRGFRDTIREHLGGGLLYRNLPTAAISYFPPDAALVERTVADLMRERGGDGIDVAFDLGIESDLAARFRLAVLNVDEAATAELIAHEASVLGLSDAGAHASQLCDAGLPTDLLGRWVRDKGVLSLQEAVRRLTSEPADLLALADRGRLAVGHVADVTLFDPATVACGPLRRVRDFPAGADRLVTDAIGVRAVVVAGTVIREDGRDVVDPNGALPGRVVRGS
jgi:N-acyl-D-aspartate/D-glutamate deacylase